MKKALQWFEQLPEPIRTQAIENSNGLDNTYSSLYQCLGCNFTWFNSPQGHKYWEDICNRANAGEFDPPNLHGWIPVSERLPDMGDSDELGDVMALTKDDVKKIVNWIAIKPTQIKFWQPLPKLPEVKS